jgi:hypothetical protein
MLSRIESEASTANQTPIANNRRVKVCLLLKKKEKMRKVTTWKF